MLQMFYLSLCPISIMFLNNGNMLLCHVAFTQSFRTTDKK